MPVLQLQGVNHLLQVFALAEKRPDVFLGPHPSLHQRRDDFEYREQRAGSSVPGDREQLQQDPQLRLLLILFEVFQDRAATNLQLSDTTFRNGDIGRVLADHLGRGEESILTHGSQRERSRVEFLAEDGALVPHPLFEEFLVPSPEQFHGRNIVGPAPGPLFGGSGLVQRVFQLLYPGSQFLNVVLQRRKMVVS